ncbi:MAG: rRNA maturation RNase YbeY [bacterium]|nr:rRNA maturation RNase YbeY [bacterium]
MKKIFLQNNLAFTLPVKYIKQLKSLTLQILETEEKTVTAHRHGGIFDKAGCSTSLKLPSNIEIGITFVDNTQIKKLNAKYRKKNTPTDVIAFRIDAETSKKSNKNVALGDIYISVERASEQIIKGETLALELVHLLIHGVLHVLGYDHSVKMRSKEKYYFKKFSSNY